MWLTLPPHSNERNQAMLSAIRYCVFLASALALSGCSKIDLSELNPQNQKVSVLRQSQAPKPLPVPIKSNNDSQLVNSFPIIQSESREFNYLPPLKSGDIYIHGIRWDQGKTSILVEPVAKSYLTIVNNKKNCGDSTGSQVVWGILGTLAGARDSICFNTYYTTNTTTLQSSSNYTIDGGESEEYSRTVNSKEYIYFYNTPSNILTGFKLSGPDWESGHIEAGLSEEDKRNAENVKAEMTKRSKELSFRARSLLINSNYRNPIISNFVSADLLEKLRDTCSLDAYSVVIDNITQDAFKNSSDLKKVAVNYLLLIYETGVMPANDSYKIAKFLEQDGTSLPEENYLKIFNDGLAVESEKISITIKKLEELGGLKKITHRLLSGETEQDIKELVLRGYYTATIQEKNTGNKIRSLMMYKALVDNKATATSKVAFDLQKDQEMKDFLATQFKQLSDGFSSNSEIIVDAIRKTNKELKVSLNQIAQNTNIAPETREEERNRNWRMAMDMHYATKTVERK